MTLCSGIPGRACSRPHARAVVRGMCRTCQYRERRMHETGSSCPQAEVNYLPAAPLLTAVAARAGSDLTEAITSLTGLEYSHTGEFRRIEQAFNRANESGKVSVYFADEFCCTYLNVHPCAIYGEVWWDLSEKASNAFTEEVSSAA